LRESATLSDFIHAREYLNDGDIVVVNCDTQCNVLVMDDYNFDSYRRGGQATYYGGFYQRLPARISVPSTGYWNVVLDLGGGQANIRYGFSYIKRNG
jgi:hypothetical protein